MAMRIRSPKLGDWDYDGYFTTHTFSVDIFQWVLRLNGNGIRRGTTIKRISGCSNNPEKIYAEAEEWIRQKEQQPH